MALCDSCHRNPVSKYCHDDNAKLCYPCDMSLHSMNSQMSNHKRVWLCEVCTSSPAVVHCEVDSANMCANCDELIHGSNILAALHVRQPLELSKRYLAANAQTEAAARASPTTSDDVNKNTRNSSLANMLMVEGLNTFVSPKANMLEIEEYKRQCEEVLKAVNSMHQPSVDSSRQMNSSLHNIEPRSMQSPARMSLPQAMQQPGTADMRVSDLQQRLADAHGITGKLGASYSTALPGNLNELLKNRNLESASSILREACIGLREPDIVDQLLQGLGEHIQNAGGSIPSFYSGAGFGGGFGAPSAADGGFGGGIGAHAAQGVDANAPTTVEGPSDTFVMPTSVLHVGNAQPLDREARVARYKEKRKNRKFEKTVRYASRAIYAGNRPRVKGRFAKREDQNEDDNVDDDEV